MQFECGKKMKKVQKLVNIANTIQEIEEGKIEPPKDWPHEGTLETKDVMLRYRPKLDLVLKGLNFKADKGLKIGVCGRTGAGKSTLGLTFLRILEIESGTIEIDGIDIKQVALQTLRERVTTIPQDPTLFKGTLRFNIDPYEKHSNEEIDDLLSRTGLQEIMKLDEMEAVRAFKVEEGGSNLSDGEKQLICICRAALRKAKVVVFDEATANIDVVTEQKTMELIKKEFAGATVLTIAHRLNTIINSDKIAVMSFGQLVEYGPPAELLKKPDSEFFKLVNKLQAEEQENS
jgi:ABC-type multidrug transport system fused ATPase/permease subunit